VVTNSPWNDGAQRACTAVAPDVVRTVRTYTARAGYGHRLVRKSAPLKPLQASKHGNRTRQADEKWAEIRRAGRRDHGARIVTTSSIVMLNAPPPYHLTGWDAITWLGYTLAALIGWAVMAVPVYRVHQFDIKRRTQQFTKWETAWEYIIAACIPTWLNLVRMLGSGDQGQCVAQLSR
jgi:hypothetical protein